MAIDLTDKVCLVTGADEGIGRGLVQGFLRRGAKVAAGLLHAERSAAQVAPALAVQMDVTQAAQVEAAIAQVVAHFGRIDVLVNNAGIYPRRRADEISFADWRRVLDLNLDGTWRCCAAVIPHFQRQGGGVIVNTGSVTVRSGAPELAHYEASKAGIVGLTRGLARDLGPQHIRVNCIHLGAVRTEGELRQFPDQAAVLKLVEEKQCLPGRLTPESVEPAFAFLASDDAGDITGQCLTVDRGWAHD